jgi:hypothetical protein
MRTLFIFCFVLFSSLSLHAQKTIDLFNGKDLNNWNFVLQDNKPNTGIFSVKDGIIHISGNPFGYMHTKEKYGNFRLHVEWRWPGEANNSGIFLFVQDDNKVWPNAIECQLKAGNAGDLVLLGGSDIAEFKTNPGEERPKFPVVKNFNPTPEMAAGEWNNADIICEDGSITIYINGVLQNKGTKSMHKSGYIGLQSEGKDIQFRNVRLTPL